MSITDVCIKRPVLAWMMMAVVVLFGIIAVQKIGVAQFPDVDQPNVTISVTWTGASPVAIESEVLEPIEVTCRLQVEGLQETNQVLFQGKALAVRPSFDMSKNIDVALQDIQAKVNAIARDLPSDLLPIQFSKSNPDDTPIITVGISGPVSRQVLSDAGVALTEELQHVNGVGSIDVQGHVDRNVRIWLDEKKMAEKKVAVTDIVNSIGKQHVQMPGGTLISGGRQLSVRLLGEALNLDDLKALVVAKTPSGLVRLGDVAVIEDGFADVNSFARLNGQPVQALGILKQPGSNAIQVAKDVRVAIADIQKRMGNVQLTILSDTTVFIEESVQEMELELGLALVLTAFVCWLFLGSLSSTLNVILAIPMSLLGTVGVNYFLGYTLNTFTLLGLSLAVGLVVDDAVMVMENIYRHAEMGKNRVQASADGTKEITFPALAATAAVIAIFLPVVFMNGMIGRFFLQFGVTLSIAVTLSYIEAITLAPARCSQILNVSKENRGFIGRTVDAGFSALERFYGRTARTRSSMAEHRPESSQPGSWRRRFSSRPPATDGAHTIARSVHAVGEPHHGIGIEPRCVDAARPAGRDLDHAAARGRRDAHAFQHDRWQLQPRSRRPEETNGVREGHDGPHPSEARKDRRAQSERARSVAIELRRVEGLTDPVHRARLRNGTRSSRRPPTCNRSSSRAVSRRTLQPTTSSVLRRSRSRRIAGVRPTSASTSSTSGRRSRIWSAERPSASSPPTTVSASTFARSSSRRSARDRRTSASSSFERGRATRFR